MAESIKCKTCETGTMVKRKKYRMSGVVVVIGYIILIPSVLGILFGVFGVVTSGAATSGVMDASKTAADSALRAVNVPEAVIAKVTALDGLAASDTVSLTSVQRAAIRSEQLGLSAGIVGAGLGGAIAGGFFLFMAVGSLVSGLLGWLLVMKKKVLQCTGCGAVVAAS